MTRKCSKDIGILKRYADIIEMGILKNMEIPLPILPKMLEIFLFMPFLSRYTEGVLK
jgi:hypothetical protein